MTKKNYQILRNKKEIEDLVSLLYRHDKFCHDFETTSLETHSGHLKIVGCAFAVNPNAIYYIPFNDPNMGLNEQEIIDIIRGPIEDENIKKIGQNLKYEYRVWNKFGVTLRNIYIDTMIASYCLFCDKFSHALDEMTLRLLGHIKIRTAHVIAAEIESPIVEEEVIVVDAKGKKKKAKKKKKVKKTDKTMMDSPIEIVAEYCCEDVEYTFRLANYYEYLFSLPENANAFLNYRTIERPLISVLSKMECNGVNLDLRCLSDLKDSIIDSIQSIKIRIDEVAGFELSITKAADIAKVVYDQLDLFNKNNIVPKKTKSGKLATNEKVLTKIEHEPFIKDILEVKKLNKLVNTYLKPIPAKVSTYTNKLHCNFLQHITTTTRLACITGDSKILLEDGTFCNIEDIYRKDIQNVPIKVITHTGNSRDIQFVYYNGEQEVYELQLESGKTITCTKYHKFLTKEGWKTLEELSEEDSIFEISEL